MMKTKKEVTKIATEDKENDFAEKFLKNIHTIQKILDRQKSEEQGVADTDS